MITLNNKIEELLDGDHVALRKFRKLLHDPNRFFEDYFAKRRKRTTRPQSAPSPFSIEDYEEQYRPLKEHSIVYESFHGRKMSCNPYALFKCMLNDSRFEEYEHVWILQEPERYCVEDFPGFGTVKFVKRGSRQHHRYLETARYLINNSTFPPWFSRRPDQIYVNTQHGVPLKTMGNDVLDSFGGAANVARNFLQATHLLMPNRYTTEVMLKSHNIEGIFEGTVVEAGYPRTDLAFQGSHFRRRLRQTLGIPEKKKVILYAPTFRGRFNAAVERSEEAEVFLEELQARFGHDYWILDRSHYSNRLKGPREGQLIDNVDTNELLSIVDILITDYSSVCFDVFAQKKPVLYFAYDLEEYQNSRGLYVDLSELPGKLCRTQDEVFEQLESIDGFVERHADSYERAIRKFCSREDGAISKRVIDWLFFGKGSMPLYEPQRSNRTKFLIYGGSFLNNGVTASVTALLENFDRERFEIYIAFDKRTSAGNVARFRSRVPPDVNTLFFVSSGRRRARNPYWHGVREAKRLYGDASFDIALDASGYGQYWPSVLVNVRATQRFIYLHNCMKSEQQIRPHTANFEYLFELYEKKFDKLITVSKSSFEANAEHLPHVKHKLVCLDNFILHRRILEQANIGDVDRQKTNFVNVGRYEFQKGQSRLIDAFAELNREYPETNLYLIGYGKDHARLEQQVRRLGLEGKVHLTGALENPFRLMKQCDCFVLSSNYEGQGIVLLESLVLGLPTISTDIPGPQSVLEKKYLYDNSVEGLLTGMRDFMRGKVDTQKFEPESYNARSLRKLDEIFSL